MEWFRNFRTKINSQADGDIPFTLRAEACKKFMRAVIAAVHSIIRKAILTWKTRFPNFPIQIIPSHPIKPSTLNAFSREKHLIFQ